MAIISAYLMVYSASAIESVDAASQVVGSESGREAAKAALDGALKMAKSKPAMITATGIVHSLWYFNS